MPDESYPKRPEMPEGLLNNDGVYLRLKALFESAHSDAEEIRSAHESVGSALLTQESDLDEQLRDREAMLAGIWPEARGDTEAFWRKVRITDLQYILDPSNRQRLSGEEAREKERELAKLMHEENKWYERIIEIGRDDA